MPLPRIRTALLALLAVTLTPAVARAAHQHDLQLDKQEIFAEVPSGGAVTSLRASCSSGYRVIQGSVRVDTVPGGSLTSIRIRTSAPDTDPSKWFYELVNVAPRGSQAAQVKLMISCIKPTTSGGSGSQHSVQFAPRYDTAVTVPAGRTAPTTLDLPCQGPNPFESPGYIPAGTGWVFDPHAGFSQLTGAAPTVAQLATSYALGDSQNLDLGGSAQQAAYTLYGNVVCLKRLTTAATGEGKSHQHYLDASVQLVTRQVPRTQGSTGYFTQSVSCPSSYYAIAPTFSIPATASANGLRIVGIGYQGDQDPFRLVNPNGDGGFVTLGVICLGVKTSFTNSASPGAGPGPQHLIMRNWTVALQIGRGDVARGTVGCAGKTDIVTAGGLDGRDASAVDVISMGGGGRANRWRYALRNTLSRTARVTLALKCLSPWAEGHTLVVDGLPSAAPDGVTACEPGQIAVHPSTEGAPTGAGARYLCLERNTTNRINHTHQLHTRTVTRRVDGRTTIACPRSYQAVVPRISLGRRARLVTSAPDGRAWTLRFGGAGRSTVRITCLKDSTTPEVAKPVVQEVQ